MVCSRHSTCSQVAHCSAVARVEVRRAVKTRHSASRWVLACVLACGLLGLHSLAPRSAWSQDGVAPPAPSAEKSDDVRRWLERVGGVRVVNPLQRDHSNVRTAFAEVVAETRLATVRLLVDDLQVALGAIVEADGYVLTKASEMHGKVVCVLSDGRQLPAEIVGVHEDFDLALLHVDAHELPVVKLSLIHI